MLSNDVRERVYKSLETDAEFLARIRRKHAWWSPWNATSDVLDREAWDELKMQRRIVERTSGC